MAYEPQRVIARISAGWKLTIKVDVSLYSEGKVHSFSQCLLGVSSHCGKGEELFLGLLYKDANATHVGSVTMAS